MLMNETKSRIESELEVKAYLQNLKYALDNGAEVSFQSHRLVDENRDIHFTNQYTVDKLFANEDIIVALTRELKTLTVEEYIRTVQDIRFPRRSEMREFGKVYNGAEKPFENSIFPYRKKEEVSL